MQLKNWTLNILLAVGALTASTGTAGMGRTELKNVPKNEPLVLQKNMVYDVRTSFTIDLSSAANHSGRSAMEIPPSATVVLNIADGAELKLGGMGYGDAVFAAELPAELKVPCNKMKTLDATAYGATAYQWYKDGVAIENATGATLDIPWVRKAPDAGYTCEATFNVYGQTEKVMSSPCTVTMNPVNMMLIVR